MKDKHYILRTPLDPFEIVPYSDLYAHIGNNVGNLVYVAGVTRAMMVTDGTTFSKTAHHFEYTDAEIDEINETCDGFLISLADAIRPNYIDRMKQMTETIRRLKIPCVIIGIGLRAPYEPGSDMSYPFDDDVRDFCAAVLDHSAAIGVRGQITGDYLKHLGFREEQDYTVIGCPSMYMYGRELPFRDNAGHFVANSDAPCSFNLSPQITPKTYSLIEKAVADNPNAVYMPQNGKDEKLMYYGINIKEGKRPDYFPTSLDHPFYTEHDARFYSHPMSWIIFQGTRDISFGTRLHGNITAVLAGTPALFMPQVARTRELCDYHGFACMSPHELEEVEDLRDVIAKMDFSSPVKAQGRNFDHYLDFLRRNDLENIFDSGIGAAGEAPYDWKVRGFEELPPLHAMTREPGEEQERRKREWSEKNPPANKDKSKGQKKSVLSRIKRKISRVTGK